MLWEQGVAPSQFRWLYLDFNSYFASVEQQVQPHLRNRPVAVVPVDTDSTCAIAASYEAKAFGVKTGTPIYEAKRMCPGLVCVMAHHERYVDYHHRILKEVDRHIPISAVCSIDEVACRLMDNETERSRIIEMALSIKRGLAARVGEYVKCSIGVATNKYLAKVATDIQKPDGLTFLDPLDFPGKLLMLELSDLPGIGFNMERRLLNAGITTMSDLLALSPRHMRALWHNVWGERLWYFLRGWEIPEEETHRSTVGHSHVLAPEMRAPKKAFTIAQRLVIKAASRLRRLGYYAKALSLGVRLEKGEKLWIESRCEPAQDSFTFVHLLKKQWVKIFEGRTRERVKKLGVTLHHLSLPSRGIGEQPSLFEKEDGMKDRCRKKQEVVSHVMDSINQKYGRDAILLGLTAEEGKNSTGTKVAFTRIPDAEEFAE